MLNRCSTDICLEYEVQLILSEIEAVEDILKENKNLYKENKLMYYNTTQNVAIDNNSLTSIEKQRCLMRMQRML